VDLYAVRGTIVEGSDIIVVARRAVVSSSVELLAKICAPRSLISAEVATIAA
jgi:hypothetical protein